MTQRILDFDQRERRERLIATIREKLDGYVRNCVGLPPHLKRMLMALHARCIAKRFCWPSLRTLAHDLGYSTESEDWPSVKRTMIRHTQALKQLGLLWMEPRFDAHDSQTSNDYRIKYQNLRRFYQPENVDESKAFPGPTRKTLKRGSRDRQTPVTVSPGGCHQCHRGGDTSVTGGVTSVSPRELNLNSTRTEAEVLADESKTRTAASGGGLGSNPEFPDNSRKPRGYWTGLITRDLLKRPEYVNAIYHDAVKAGLIKDTQINRIRIVALARQSAFDEQSSAGGILTGRIETKSWNYLHPDRVRDTARILGVTLTPELMAKIRTPGT